MVLAVFCQFHTVLQSSLSSGQVILSICILITSALGLLMVRYTRHSLIKNPFWKAAPWFYGFTAVNATLWGLFAFKGDGGFCLSLAIAMAGLAAAFLVSHGRLVITGVAPIGILPLAMLFQNQSQFLVEVHLPMIGLISIVGFHAYQITMRTARNDMETNRLNRLLTQNQAELEQRILDRTHQLEDTNRRLSTEVQLRKEVNQALMESEEQLNLAMTSSGIGFWDWDIAQRRVYHSDTEKFFGFSESLNDDLVVAQSIHPADQPKVKRALIRHLKGKTDYYQARYRVIQSFDKVRWLEDIGRITERDEKGSAARMIGTRRDITQDMMLQEELKLSSSLFNNSNDGVFVLDEHQHLRTCNTLFCDILGRGKAAMVGLSIFDILVTDHSDIINSGLSQHNRWSGDLVFSRYDGERFSATLTITVVRGSEGNIAHYLGIFRDQTEKDRAEKELSFLHNYDKLTGLFNRSYFHDRLHKFSQQPELANNRFAICVLNLDRFKSVNESLGLEVGDLLLKDVAARLSNLSAAVETVARLSSDEFALIIQYNQDQDLLLETLANIRADVTRPYLIKEHELVVTASIGVCPIQQGNLGQLLNHAIAAMNQARYEGGNNYKFYLQKLPSTSLDRMKLERMLRYAIEHDEFQVNYQPKLNLSTGIIDSVEALVRWVHPEKGVIDPEEFIPLAEETGLIDDLGTLILTRACFDAATWQQNGQGDITVAVNLSSHQIRRADLYDTVHSILQNSKLPAECLELEITESMLMEDISHAQDFLNQLRSLGVRLVLDDFGTGYSSLNYLKRLPIDTLKIDRSFISEVRDGRVSAIVEAIMAMAESLKLSVVAEGVETQEQLNYLKTLKCDYAQGYIISRALPAAEMLTLVRHANLNMLTNSPNAVH